MTSHTLYLIHIACLPSASDLRHYLIGQCYPFYPVPVSRVGPIFRSWGSLHHSQKIMQCQIKLSDGNNIKDMKSREKRRMQ